MPTTTRKGYVWEEFSVENTDSVNGRGLFAKVDLPTNFCIPFGGVYRPCFEWQRIEKHRNQAEYTRNSYAVSVTLTDENGTKEEGVMDAHPKVLENLSGAPSNAWPGANCKQALQEQHQNADHFQNEGQFSAPSYEWMDEKCRNLFVKLKRPIKVGDEILVNYNYSKTRQ